jgi:hypothetical protein
MKADAPRPSLTVIARRTQATAAANGMTDKVHDELLRSIKNDPPTRPAQATQTCYFADAQ